MINGEYKYKHFVDYFVEIELHLDKLISEALEYFYERDHIPQSHQNEIYRHEMILTILTEVAKEKYNKSPEMIVEDFKNKNQEC
jgi:hypothetical protein